MDGCIERLSTETRSAPSDLSAFVQEQPAIPARAQKNAELGGYCHSFEDPIRPGSPSPNRVIQSTQGPREWHSVRRDESGCIEDVPEVWRVVRPITLCAFATRVYRLSLFCAQLSNCLAGSS